MIDILTGLFKVKLVAFDLIRWPDEQLEIFRHLTFNSYTKVDECTFFNSSRIEILSEFITPNVCIDNQ